MVNSSGREINPNSEEFHRIKSSESLDKWSAVIEHADANSKNKSRSATASIPFAVRQALPSSSTKPRAFATYSRSNGKVEPAIAPEPKGQEFACLATTENLS